MIRYTRFHAFLKVAGEWSASRRPPLQECEEYALSQLFISPIRRMYAGCP